jgi:hypothetical protein
MKACSPISGLLLLVTGLAWGQQSMTLGQFNKLVATPGDTNGLRPELAAFPFWKTARCTNFYRFQDGRELREECGATTKTIGGKYVVYSMDSQYYKEPIRAIIEYDDSASAIKSWGIITNSVAVTTVVCDPQKKITASTGTHGEFTEISVGTYSETEASDRVWVYKGGVLFVTRETKSWPVKAEPGGAANRSQPIRSETNRTSAAAGSGR